MGGAPSLAPVTDLLPAPAFGPVQGFAPLPVSDTSPVFAPASAFANFPKIDPAPEFASNPSYDHAPFPLYAPHGIAPKQSCSVISELTTVEVCTPTLQTTCGTMEMPVKTITDREQCMNITHTVCSKSEEELVNEICVYSYQNKTEDTMATNHEIAFEKECKTQKVSVCQPSADYEDGEQDCKEEEQETCYNVPMVLPKQETLTVTYPEPMMDCKQKPISIPRVTCEYVTEEMCTIVPDIMNDIVMMEKCEVYLGSPPCQVMELTLPKQVCTELVNAQIHEIEKEMELEKQKMKIKQEMKNLDSTQELKNMDSIQEIKSIKQGMKLPESMQELKKLENNQELEKLESMKQEMEKLESMDEGVKNPESMQNTIHKP